MQKPITIITILCLLAAEFAVVHPKPGYAQTGTRRLVLISTPSGAEVYVDNRLMGSTPFSARFAPGTYRVRVSQDGYVDWLQTVRLQDDQRFVITLRRGVQPQNRAWLWTLLGVVVAGGAAAGAYVVIRNRVSGSSGGTGVDLPGTPPDPP